jgi:RNase H-like domain found in reverse transcriptase/Reverse transcriptase (RNA-dependent DNA polymerase)
VLQNNPDLIKRVIEENFTTANSVKTETVVENEFGEDWIWKEYEALFGDQINIKKPCLTNKHQIDTGQANPVFVKSGRIPIHFENAVEQEINKNLELGIIRESESPWSSRIVPVCKPDGSVRLCIDYRPLNKLTVKDKYPIPRIDEILDSLASAKFFTTLDATSGYYQLEVEERDKEKTAFSWKGGHYEFNRMPFGLCNAPATFQWVMDIVLKEGLGKFVIPYLDDIIIYSATKEDHIRHLRQVLEKLKASGLILNKNKCKFMKKEVKLLGSIISEGLVKPGPEKINSIKNYPLPRTVKELRSFLGIANYCREFVKNFASKAKGLFDLLKGETKRSNKILKHTEETIQAFHLIRKSLTEETSRAQPNFEKEFILTTDASETGIGAILSQIDDNGVEKMISAFSKNFDKHQLNYSVTDKELLAVVKSINHYRHYLLGKEFLLKTDHKALTYLWETKNPTSRLLRWSMILQEYEFKI